MKYFLKIILYKFTFRSKIVYIVEHGDHYNLSRTEYHSIRTFGYQADHSRSSGVEQAVHLKRGVPGMELAASQWHPQRYDLPEPIIAVGIKGTDHFTSSSVQASQPAGQPETACEGRR